MRHRAKPLPRWTLMLVNVLLVFLIGYADYRTGDYSLLIFYAFPISLGSWYLGRWHGIALGCTAGCARLVSDYYSYADNTFRFWNSLQDMVFLLLAGILVSTVRALLADEGRRPG